MREARGKDAESKWLIHHAKNGQNAKSSHSCRSSSVKWPMSKSCPAVTPESPELRGDRMMLKLQKLLQDRCFTAQHCWPCPETKAADASMSQCLLQAGWGQEYPEAPPCKPCNISWLLGWDQEPLWTPAFRPWPSLDLLSHLGRQHCTSRLERPTFENKKLMYI